MRASEWMIAVLDRYGLNKPDGRPLYQYRITDREYDELHKLLKLSAILGIENLTSSFLWDAAFVMYGAEWWRRHYTGEWGWDGIFNSVGINYRDLPTGKRNDLIETGLHRWRRQVRVNDGRRGFLPTVATEGGLPLHQFADSGGWLKAVLKPVLRKHVARDIDISVLVDNYENLIPKSYRTTELKNILTDIVQTVISLRNEHQLMNRESPLAWLDDNLSSWRKLFPLPIDDESAKSLLSDLIDTAAKTKEDDSNKNPFEIERFLIRAESTNPEFVSQIDMPTFVFLNNIGFDAEATATVASTFDVEVYEPGGSMWPWCRAILTTYREKQALKLSGRTLKLSGLDATKELKLRFKSMGKTIHEFELNNGSALDIDVPWLFKSIDNRWSLHGIASQSVKDEFAMIYIPQNCNFESLDENTHILEHGVIFSGNILKISGIVNCASEDVRYKLSAGIEESVTQYHLTGKRFSYNSTPGVVFIGLPDLRETNLITGISSKKHSNRLLAKPIGSDTQWRPLSQGGSGYFEVRLLDESGNIQLRKRIGILDKNFSFTINPDNHQVGVGNIQLSNIGECEISICDSEIINRIEQNANNADVHLEVASSPPMSVALSLILAGHCREILLSFPFPSKGALLFDYQGKQISFSVPLFLNELKGYRIKVYNESSSTAHKVDLRFSLIDPSMSRASLKDIYIQRKVDLDAGVTVFSLYDWAQYIDSLMSVSSSLDSTVLVSMLVHGQEAFKIMVRRYENEIHANWDEGTIALDSTLISQMSLNVLEGIHLSSFYLNQPEQADAPLVPVSSGGALTGEWLFYPEKRQSGPWLIYPLVDSQIKFRTLLWNVGVPDEINYGDLAKISTLPSAICIAEHDARNIAIRQVLKLMAMDMGHRSWGYLDCLWKKTSHLPMVTFDLWKIAITEPKFLACLLISDYDDVVEKLEGELPLIWELVHLINWDNSLSLYKSKIVKSLGDDEELVNELLDKKILKIESLSLSMKSTGEILRHKFLGVKSQGLRVMQLPASSFLQPQLNEAMQDLLRRQSYNDWPVLLNNHIRSSCSKLPHEYVSLLSNHHSFQSAVTYLPLLLAWRLLSPEISDWPNNATDIFKIQQLKYFDEDWFNLSFQYLSGWLSQQNYFEMNHDV